MHFRGIISKQHKIKCRYECLETTNRATGIPFIKLVKWCYKNYFIKKAKTHKKML